MFANVEERCPHAIALLENEGHDLRQDALVPLFHAVEMHLAKVERGINASGRGTDKSGLMQIGRCRLLQ